MDTPAATSATDCPVGSTTVSTGSTSIADCLLDVDGDGIPDAIDPDDDNDGVLDATDVCAGTVLPEDEPARAKKNRFFTAADGDFVDGEGNLPGISVVDTGGCSRLQIIEALGLGRGHVRQGIPRGILATWIASLP